MSYREDDQDLLNDPDKRVGEARGVLSVLWRQLLVVRDIDGWRWDKLMKNFLADPRNGIQNNSRDRSSARGNLNKELKRDDMTWRVFLKALNFLDPIRVVFSVKITFKDGTTNEVTAKLKDRGTVMTQAPAARPDDEDEVPPGLGDPVDEVDELHTTEHRPSLRHPVRRFTPDDIVNAINGR
jgi:hypothetical protein